MKRFTYPFLLLAGLLVLASAISPRNDGAFDAQINTLKQECKALISATRYEGSKITYFNAGPKKQKKSVEVFLFLPNEYQFAISAKKCSGSLTVKIYDAHSDSKERTLIKEFKQAEGKNFTFNSTELNELYRQKVPEADRLKNLHIEYSIGAAKAAKEAIVLVMGHKP